mmetsp:Transcript_20058/g.67851  ORF Transcript_20058/g.67851 Transcript_20058/m.67851 type:complete len:667 (-) Transcript_20058:119-2119(-)
MVSQMFAAAIAVQPSVGVAALDLPSTSTSPPQSGFALWHHFFASYPPPPPPSAAAYPSKLRFDRSFLFGVATAPAHVEDNLHDAWLPFCNTTELHPNGRPHCHAWRTTPRAAERLRFWSEPEVEIGLAAALNSGVFRMGVDWSRLAPTSPSAFPNASAPVAPACSAFCEAREEAKVGASPGAPPEGCACSGVQDFEALARYREIVGMAKAKGMKVVLTLFHHSLPVWVGEAGGWTNEAVVREFGSFVRDVAAGLGESVDYWLTMNEPMAFALFTYIEGTWPQAFPQSNYLEVVLKALQGDERSVKAAIDNLAGAHNLAYSHIHQMHTLRGWRAPQVGMAARAQILEGKDPWDGPAVMLSREFMDFTITDKIQDRLDFLGLNYYGKEVISGQTIAQPTDVGYSEAGRAIDTEGLYSVLQMFHERYVNKPGATWKRFMVTENGVADATDVLRPAFITEHLAAIAAAVSKGIDVFGYIHWTISDNWEWADGYCPKFGLVDVDRADNLRRHRRPSFALFRDIVAKRRVTVPQREDAWAQVQAAVAAGATHRFCRADDGQSSLDAAIERPFSDKDWRFSAAEAEVDRQKEMRSQTQKHTSAVTDSVAEVTSTINQTIWGMWDSIPGQDEVNAGVYNTLNDTMLGLGHAIWGNWLDSNEEVLEAAVVEGREV